MRTLMARDHHLTILDCHGVAEQSAMSLIGAGIVWLDPTRDEDDWIADAVHELVHHLHPDWAEEKVEAHTQWLLHGVTDPAVTQLALRRRRCRGNTDRDALAG